MSPHVFHLSQTKPHNQTSGGIRIKATKKNFPILREMSLFKVTLYPGGIREPHWHPNADELGYCLKGKALMTIYGNGDLKQSFTIESGESFFVPSGFLHHIENAGDSECHMIFQFSHEEPEDFGISSSLGFLSNAVLGNTWGIDQNVFKTLKRSTEASFAVLRKAPIVIPEDVQYSSPYKYNLGGAEPTLMNEGGLAKMGRQNTWPILKRQALYLLHLSNIGMREPHWHPATGELGYVVRGKARMSILDPSGSVDTYVIDEGDIYFVPKGYPHHIENLTNEELQLAIFFDQAMPGDIGFSASIRAYSNEVLGATMHIDPAFFDPLHKYYRDLFIVQRVNPLDK